MNGRMITNLRTAAALALIAAFAGGSTAVAQEPTLQGYGGQGGEVLPNVQSGGGTPPAQQAPAGENFVLGDVESGGGNTPAAGVQGDTAEGGAAPTAAAAPAEASKPVARVVGDLPFTGFDVVLILAAGGGLLLLGFALRRMARPQTTA